MGVFMQVMMAQGGWSRTWPTGRLNKTLFYSSSIKGDVFCVSSCDGCFMRGGGGRAVHFTSFGWAKCKYQWEIFSRNCSWRGEEICWGTTCLSLQITGLPWSTRVTLSLQLRNVGNTRWPPFQKESLCCPQSKDWRVPKVKECYWCLTPRVTDAI